MTESTTEETPQYVEPGEAMLIMSYYEAADKIMISPGTEEQVAGMIQDDPSQNYFFMKISTDMEDMETVPLEQYLAYREAQDAAVAPAVQVTEVTYEETQAEQV